MDGKTAGASTVRRNRTILANASDYAVELGLLENNLIRALKWTARHLEPVPVCPGHQVIAQVSESSGQLSRCEGGYGRPFLIRQFVSKASAICRRRAGRGS